MPKKSKRKGAQASGNASVNTADQAVDENIDETADQAADANAGNQLDAIEENPVESKALDSSVILQNMPPAGNPDTSAAPGPAGDKNPGVDAQTLLRNQAPSSVNIDQPPPAPTAPLESFESAAAAPSSVQSISSMMRPSFEPFDPNAWRAAGAERERRLGRSNPLFLSPDSSMSMSASPGYPMSMSASGMERKGGGGGGRERKLVVNGQRAAAGGNAAAGQARAPHVHLVDDPLIPRPFHAPHPITTPNEERAERDLSYMDDARETQRVLTRFMLTPRETKVHTVICYLNPATNGVREKDRSIRGVIQGDMVYHNFSYDQTLVAANTRIPLHQNVELGISMVTQGEIVEGDTINYPVAVSGALTAIFRGFKVVDRANLREEYVTCAPGERFGLDLSSAAVETGNTDRVRRVVYVHRMARGRAGFCSSLNTALGIGYPGYGLEIVRDY